MTESPLMRASNYRLLRIYCLYRFVLATLLLVMFIPLTRQNIFGEFQPELYLLTSSTYLLVNLVTLVYVLRRSLSIKQKPMFALLSLDIAAVVLITHASSGIGGGFALLLLITSAMAGIFL